MCTKGSIGGVETPNTPDKPDALDGGDVVEGIGGGDLATSASSEMGCLMVSGSREGVFLAARLEYITW